MDAEFAGNEAALTVLRRAAMGGRRHHAYLIYGEKGLGKQTFAMLFARALLCQAETERPCGRCRACHKAENGTHPDLTVLIGEKRGSIHVEDVRKLRADCVVRPNEAPVRVYVIVNMQDMTEEAFNAFLKTLEEPPLHTVFLLTAESPGQLPQTVVSRALPVELYPLAEEEAARWLRRRFPQRTAEECLDAAAVSGGNLGKAVEMLASPDSAGMEELARRLLRAAEQGREYELLQVFSVYEKDKAGQNLLLERWMERLRLALLQPGSTGLRPEQIVRLIEFGGQAREKLDGNANGTLLGAFCAAGVWNAVRGRPAEEA